MALPGALISGAQNKAVSNKAALKEGRGIVADMTAEVKLMISRVRRGSRAVVL